MAQVPDAPQILDTANLTYVHPDSNSADSAFKHLGDLKNRVTIQNDIPQPEDPTFDLVLVFYVSGKPNITPAEAKSLLKPNGRICVLEITHARRALKILLGCNMHWEE